MPAGAGLLLVVFLLAVLVPVGLWLLVEGETSDRQVLDRRSAEESVQRESREAPGGGANRSVDRRADRTDDGTDGNHWH